MQQNNNIVYEWIDNDKYLGFLTEQISKNFILGEPMFAASGLKIEETVDFFENIIKQSLKQNLVLVAKIKENIVGAIVNNDLFNDISNPAVDHSSQSKPILEFLERLEKPFIKKHQPISTKKILHIYLIYTDPYYQMNGIATSLFKETEKYANALGYEILIAEVTGRQTQYITLKKLNYKIENEIYYKNFEYLGKKSFDSIEDPQSCLLVSKVIK